MIASPTSLFNRLKRTIHLYDPGYFSLVYALKATFTTFICAGLGALFFGWYVVIWAGLQTIFLYYLSLLLSDKKHEIGYLLLFIAISCFNVVLFYPLAHFGAWLCVPILIVTFLVGLSSAYSLDLHKVCNMALSNGLVTCLYIDAGAPIDFRQILTMITALGLLSIAIQYFIFVSKYSYFTQKRFTTLLSSMELMLRYVNSPTDYNLIKTKVLAQIHNTKFILTSRSSKIKDPHAIQNIQRSLFQLNALEEMYHSIHSIYGDFNQPTLEPIRLELVENLRLLAGIFSNHNVYLQKQALENLDPQVDKVLQHSLAIIYNKMEVFIMGGEESLVDPNPAHKASFKDIWKACHLKHPVFQYASKYALAMGIAVFVARYFGFNHGMWIAMATLFVSRTSLGSTKEAQAELITGSSIGLILGLIVVGLFAKSPIFYAFLVASVFLFIYLKVYSYVTWSMSLMFSFVLCFSLLKYDFVDIVAFRFLDIILGILIVYVVFLFVWPKYDKDEFIQHARHLIATLHHLLATTIQNKPRIALEVQNAFLRQLDAFKTCMKSARTETPDPSTLESLTRSLQSFDVLDTCSYRLYDYFLNTTLPPDKQVLVSNNVQLILSRYTQILNYLHNKPHYFKTKEGGRLIRVDNELDALLETMFFAQNKLFEEFTYIFKY
ncbi:FUSC family protein [Helicobacter mehlei]|uniref:FUSC family protein n=1 Tax=Helicobacter mehlei TaxID=2316080 RepID=UPI001F39379E|nr:FUSC family protein [Helicobacter mehlei]